MNKNQHLFIANCYNNDDCALDIISKVKQTFGTFALSSSQVYRVIQKLKKDERFIGRGRKVDPMKNKKIKAIKNDIIKDGAQTVRSLAVKYQMSHGGVHSILKNMGMKKKVAKWVPTILSPKLKEIRFLHAKKMAEKWEK